jgi:hypothetical protein
VRIIREDDAESPVRPIRARPRRRSVGGEMKRYFYYLLIAIALLVLALLGWTVRGIRTVARSRRPTLASVTG